MTRKDYILMLGLVTLSGLIGGSLTSWVVSGTVIAENPAAPAKILQVETLQIVDADGQVRIELSVEPSKGKPERIFYFDKDGKKIPVPGDTKVDWSGLPGYQLKPRIQITNDRGRIIWSAPNETEAMFVR